MLKQYCLLASFAMLMSSSLAIAEQFTTFKINVTNTGVNLGATFCPLFDAGKNVTCSVCHGDETGSMWFEPDFSSVICSAYNFTSSGFQNITAYCVVGSIFQSDKKLVYIGTPLQHVIVEDTSNNIFIPMTTTETKTIQVTYDAGTDVMINASLIDNGNNLYLSPNGSSALLQTFNVSATDLPGLGQHAAVVVVWNEISSFSRYLVFAVADPIAGFLATTNLSSPYVLLVDDTVVFSISTTNGSDVIYSTEIGDIAYMDPSAGRSYAYTHIFNETGVFIIIMSASNYVSGFETEMSVAVVNKVNRVNVTSPRYALHPNILFTFAMDSNALVPMGNLSGRIETGGALVAIVDLKALTPGLTIGYTNSSLPVGTHEFFVSIYSEISSLNFSLTVTLEKLVQNLDFLFQSQVKLSDPQTISVRLQNAIDGPLYNLSCEFNISNVIYSKIFDLDGTNNGSLDITYPDVGLLAISVNCSNHLNSLELTGIANVSSDCFEVGNLFSPSYKTESSPLSMVITNDNTITSKGVITLTCRNSSRDYIWELFPKLKNGTYVKDLYYSNPVNQPNSSSIFFGRETISEGQYRLRTIVNLTDLAQFMQDDMFIDFRLPAIATGIAGGSVRYVTIADDLVIDAAPNTFDKVMKYKNIPFEFEWVCRQGVSQSNVDMVQGLFGSLSEPNISTLGTPCTVSPTSPTPVAKWTIPSGNLLNNTWYLIQVIAKMYTNVSVLGIEVQETVRSARAIQAVFVQQGVGPKIDILCKRNCRAKLSKNAPLILYADCAECSLSETNYAWSIYVYNNVTNWFESINNVPRIDQSVLLKTSLTAEEIGINVEAFNDNDRIKFQLKIVTKNKPISQAEYIVSVNAPPYGGICEATPLKGISAQDHLTVTCKNWKDEGDRFFRGDPQDAHEILTYSIYQVRNTTINNIYTMEETLLSESDDSSISSTLSIGDPNNNYLCNIKIHVRDSYYGYVVVTIPVTVSNPVNIDRTVQSNSELIGNLTGFYQNVMREALASNDPKQVLHEAQVLVAAIIIIPTYVELLNVSSFPSSWSSGLLDADGNTTLTYNNILTDLLNDYKDPVRLVIIEIIDNVTKIMENQLESNATTFFMIEMASLAFSNVLADNQLISNDAGISASNALTNLIQNFKNISDRALSYDAIFDSSDPRLETTSKALISFVSAIVGSTLPADFSQNGLAIMVQSAADSRDQVNYFASIYGDQAYNIIENSDLTPEERTGLYLMTARISAAQFVEKQDLAAISDTAIDFALQTIIDQGLNMTCKGCNITYNQTNVVLYLSKITLKDLNDAANQLLTSSNSSIILSFAISTDSNATTLLGIAVFPKNVYIAGFTDAVVITSAVHKLSVKDAVENDMIQTEVAINQTASANALLSFETLPSYTEGDASKLFYHSFFYRASGDYVCVSVDTEIPNYVTSYDVYVKQDAQPTHLDYDAKGEISPTNDWMTCFSPQLFTSTGEMYIALHANSKIDFPGVIWQPTSGAYANGSYNISKAELLPYTINIVTSACKEWDPTRQAWDASNCKMDWFPDKNIIECKCKPSFGLTFGNTFYVAPNTIDFSTVFLRFDLQSQAAVLGTLIGILIVYLVLLIWARHQDKRDIVKWGVTPLIDNFIDDTYYYLVTVYTGMRKGAGTKSRIGFIVCGEDGDTGIRELSDGVRSEIPTASVVHFLMSTPYPLGDLSYVYIWHDNSGEGDSSSWYLTRVDVEDIQKKERFIFLCGKWLCLDSEDSSIDAVLPVCGKENVTTFSNMFYLNTKENLADNHMWIAIFFRPTSSHYTRCQRLTCFLLFIFLTMIGNALYFRPEDEYSNAGTDVHVGPFSFSLRAIYIAFICALISTPTTILVIMLFKKSKPRKNVSYNIKGSSRKYRVPVLDTWMDRMMAESRELEKNLVAKGLFNTDGTILPYWCAFIAWMLALGGIVACAFFVLLFSIEWGKQKSEVWLGQFFLSFFSSTCLVDPLKVLLMSAIFAMLLKQTDKFRPTGLERSYILKNYKQRFGYDSGVRLPAPPLDTSALKKARQEREKELKMTESIKQVIITCFCLWIIYSISYSNRDNRSYNFYANIKTKLVSPQDASLMKFEQIIRVRDYIRWIRDTAFPVLYPETNYNGERLQWRLRQYFHDLTSYRVGPPRLRQLRVTSGTTDIPIFGETNTSPDYTLTSEEDRDFCFMWVVGKCDPEKEARSFSYAGWKYTKALDIWGIPMAGQYKTYGGGGYITELNVNLDFANRTLNELMDYLWFDKNTRAIFLEFNLYTPDLNLFAYNTFLTEFPETGGLIHQYSIYPFRIYQHLGSTGIYTLCCEIIFVMFLIALIIKVIYGLVKKKKAFFKSVWSVLDLTCIVLSLVGIAMYAGRYIMAAQSLEKYKKDPKQFINFQHIALWDVLFNALLACLAFLATLRLVGILGYDKRVGMVFRVFDNCAKDLFWFGIFFLHVFFCYAMLGYLLFGRDLDSYCNIFESLGTLFISMIGKSKFTELNDKDPIMAQFYFFTFILLMVYTLLTMFLAILGESINAVHNLTKRSREEELVEYLLNKFKNLFGKRPVQASSKKPELQNKPIGFLYDLRKGINDAFDQYSDDGGKPLPPAIIDFEKRAKIFDKNAEKEKQ